MKEFDAAFGMPVTIQQAVKVIEMWGNPGCVTFSSERAKKCADLLVPYLILEEKKESNTTVLKLTNSLIDVTGEIAKATKKFPTWPTDPLHALGVLHEEVGELSKEVLQGVYEPNKTNLNKIREEAVQVAAMAIRFVMSLDEYKYIPGKQHSQK